MVYDTVLDTITKNNMIEEGDRIIVGLSGGPDPKNEYKGLRCSFKPSD